MTLRQRANAFLAALVVGGGIVGYGLYHLSQTGQLAPLSSTGGAPRSDQHDQVVGSDLANHKK